MSRSDPPQPRSSSTSGLNGAGPCKMIAPILAEIADEQAGALTIAKLNVDDNPDVARRFGVMSIPTMIVFEDGQEVSRVVGAKAKGQLMADFQPFLRSAAAGTWKFQLSGEG